MQDLTGNTSKGNSFLPFGSSQGDEGVTSRDFAGISESSLLLLFCHCSPWGLEESTHEKSKG